MKKISTLTTILLVAALGLSAAACTGGGPKKPPTGTLEPDKFLFERGKETLDKKRWLVSRE